MRLGTGQSGIVDCHQGARSVFRQGMCDPLSYAGYTRTLSRPEQIYLLEGGWALGKTKRERVLLNEILCFMGTIFQLAAT